MKKVIFCVIFICIITSFTLTGCGEDNKNYLEFIVSSNIELGCIELSFDGVIYRPYGIFSDNKLKGEQIGIREGDPESKIYEVKGYSQSEWIVEYLDVIMGGNMLFKAVGVSNVPEELLAAKEYDY